jgi:hypothetical protein
LPLFGPGPHWLDEVTSGSVTFGAEASVDLDLDFDGAADLVVAVAGTTTVFRSSARARDPVADPGHRNRLHLEIVSAALATGESSVGPVTLTFGDGVGNLIADGPLYSAGVSDEIPGRPELARDVFEIFFEVEAAGLRLHNERPLVMTAVIDRLPPIGSPFTSASPPIPLVTDAGARVLQVIGARFTPLPPQPCGPTGQDAPAIGATARRPPASGASGRPNRRCDPGPHQAQPNGSPRARPSSRVPAEAGFWPIL